MKQNEVTLGRFLRILLIIATLTITYFVLDSLSGILLPFAVAWLLAYFINPLVNFIQNRLRFKFRLLSTIVALVLIGAVVYGILLLIVPSIISELNLLKDFIIAFLNNNLMNATIPEPVINFFKEIFNDKDVADVVKSVGSGDFVPILAERFQGVVTGTFNAVSQLFAMSITLLYLFFILLDFERVSRGWKPYVPKKWRGIVGKLWGDLVGGMNQYFRGQALVALCVGILYSIGLSIIDFPVAIAFGLFIGVLNLVPYLQLVSLVPMTLLALIGAANNGENFWIIMASALAVVLIVQAIQDFILVPHIMGKRMKLHPAIILLSLAIWGKLLGIVGMIMALPLTTLLLGYIRRFHQEQTEDETENLPKTAENGAKIEEK